MSEGLAQGPHVAAGMGFEPTTVRTPRTDPNTKPPRPTSITPSVLTVTASLMVESEEQID